jgi:hypothetical protein
MPAVWKQLGDPPVDLELDSGLSPPTRTSPGRSACAARFLGIAPVSVSAVTDES